MFDLDGMYFFDFLRLSWILSDGVRTFLLLQVVNVVFLCLGLFCDFFVRCTLFYVVSG